MVDYSKNMALLNFLITVTIVAFASRNDALPIPQDSKNSFSCGPAGSFRSFPFTGNISCLAADGTSNCNRMGFFPANKLRCNDCCKAYITTKEVPSTIKPQTVIKSSEEVPSTIKPQTTENIIQSIVIVAITLFAILLLAVAGIFIMKHRRSCIKRLRSYFRNRTSQVQESTIPSSEQTEMLPKPDQYVGIPSSRND